MRIVSDQLVRVLFTYSVMLMGIRHIRFTSCSKARLLPQSGKPIFPIAPAGLGAAALPANSISIHDTKIL